MQTNSKLHKKAVSILNLAQSGDEISQGVAHIFGINDSNIKDADAVKNLILYVQKLCKSIAASGGICLDFSKLCRNDKEGMIFREAAKIVLDNLSYELREKIYKEEEFKDRSMCDRDYISILPALSSLINEINLEGLSCVGVTDQQQLIEII
jgi:hypothetical protein